MDDVVVVTLKPGAAARFSIVVASLWCMFFALFLTIFVTDPKTRLGLKVGVGLIFVLPMLCGMMYFILIIRKLNQQTVLTLSGAGITFKGGILDKALTWAEIRAVRFSRISYLRKPVVIIELVTYARVVIEPSYDKPASSIYTLIQDYIEAHGLRVPTAADLSIR